MTGWARLSLMAMMLGVAAMAAAQPARAGDTGGSGFALHDPTYLTLGVGGWEFDRENLAKPQFDMVLRPAHNLWIIKPQAGVEVAGDGDVVAFAGPLIEYYFTPHLVGSISSSLATWFGPGFNLGSRLEFHSSGEVAWRMEDESRLGIAFWHTSNADLTKRNPGSDSLIVSYAIPIRLKP